MTLRRLKMITGTGQRRQFTEGFKARVVEETLALARSFRTLLASMGSRHNKCLRCADKHASGQRARTNGQFESDADRRADTERAERTIASGHQGAATSSLRPARRNAARRSDVARARRSRADCGEPGSQEGSGPIPLSGQAEAPSVASIAARFPSTCRASRWWSTPKTALALAAVSHCIGSVRITGVLCQRQLPKSPQIVHGRRLSMGVVFGQCHRNGWTWSPFIASAIRPLTRAQTRSQLARAGGCVRSLRRRYGL
jgi:hypothetical protein